MGTRTVRLDEQTERTLQRLRKATGLSISEVLKRGVQAYSEQTSAAGVRPWAVYERIDLGAGGWAAAPAREAKRAVREMIARKHGR
ncbi:MAG: ribbon-helix-helix protein, CopG family [Pseudomonadota bacterium]|jgi:Arc/MetJ-type ribon-helix-helix transcriptional regulator